MRTFWNERWVAVATCERCGTAFAHLLRALTIAAFANISLASGQEYEDLKVIDLTDEESKDVITEQYQKTIRELNFDAVGIVRVWTVTVIALPSGAERLTVTGPLPSSADLDAFQFLIPPTPGTTPAPGSFRQGFAAFVGSPAGARYCGGTTGGGTGYVRPCRYY